MKLKRQTKKNVIKDLLIILVVLAGSFLTWKHVLSIQIQGEGFFYFDRTIVLSKIPSTFSDIIRLPSDFFAILLFYFLPNIFYDNTALYMTFLLIAKLAIDLLFYFTTKKITHNSQIALISTFFFSLSFIGNYNMFASGGYQYFVQRGILLLPLLLALFFLARYILTKRLKNYFFSLFLFILSIVMGFYTSWFTPIFFFYPLNYFFTKKFSKIKILLISFSYPLINWLFIKNDAVTTASRTPLLIYLSNINNLISGISQQLAIITLPFIWDITAWYYKTMLFFYRFEVSIPVFNASPQAILPYAQITTVILYSWAFTFLWKKTRQLRPFLITFLSSIVAMLLFNQYLSTEPLKTFSSLRYFYFPSVILAIFWGMILNKLSPKVTILILLFWLWHNNYLIHLNLEKDRWAHQANKEVITTIKNMTEILKTKPYHVYLSSTLGPYGTEFTRRFYAHPDSVFSFELPIIENLASEKIKPEDIFVFRFDYPTRKLIDETTPYREKLNQKLTKRSR